LVYAKIRDAKVKKEESAEILKKEIGEKKVLELRKQRIEHSKLR